MDQEPSTSHSSRLRYPSMIVPMPHFSVLPGPGLVCADMARDVQVTSCFSGSLFHGSFFRRSPGLASILWDLSLFPVLHSGRPFASTHRSRSVNPRGAMNQLRIMIGTTL